MRKQYHWIPIACGLFYLWAGQVSAHMPTSVKSAIIRSENPRGSKERLILPYGFSSETMGLTFGIGAAAKGYGQDQLLVAATVLMLNRIRIQAIEHLIC